MEFNDSDIEEDIARRITFWREQAEISKAELSRRVRCNSGEISRWESGEVTPSVVNIHRLAAACGVSLNIFLSTNIPE